MTITIKRQNKPVCIICFVMPMSNSEAGVPKLDDIDVKDVKHSPKIKREYKSPSYKTQRRLRCPVILDNAEKPKRSRLSSPLVVDNGDFDQNSQPIESNRRAKPECPSPRRRPVERNRNDRFVSDREATWGRISNDHRDAKPPEPEKPKEQPNFELSGTLTVRNGLTFLLHVEMSCHCWFV